MPSPLAALCLVLALVLSAAPAAAQDSVRFDRRKHLPAYQEITFSEFADLYDLAPYVEAEGTLVDRGRLEELQSAWSAERERVAALLEAERSDPKRWSLFRLERGLARHEYFAQIAWTRLDDVDGFVVYVQAPKKDDPAYTERVAGANAARLAPLREHFRTAYVEPAGLERDADFGAEVVFVLASNGDFGTYAGLSSMAGHYRASSHYDGKLRVAVVAEDPFDKKSTPADKDRSVRHAYAHLLLHAYELELHSPLQQDWLHEGLASYLADLEPGPDGELVAPEPPEGTLRELVAAMQKQRELTYVRRIADLYAVPTYQHVDARAVIEAKRAQGGQLQIDWQGIQMCYWREALLLVDFLHRGERRAGFLQVLADELTGKGGPASFQRAFPGASEDELDRAFLGHLYAEHRRRMPSVAISDAAIESVLRGAAPPAAPGATPSVAGAATAPLPPFEPADLAPRDLPPQAVLALCLDLARRGRSGDAEARLAALLAGAVDADTHARVDRARRQIAAWNRLRAAWFDALAAEGGSFRFEHEDKAVRAEVERVEDGVVHLAENRARVAQVALDALEPLALAKEIGGDLKEHPDAWARAVPYALAGERRAERMLDDDDPVQAELGLDLDGDLPALIARGFPLGEMDELARTPVPRDPAGCEAVLARLAAVVGDHGDAAEVAALRAELRAYARLALAVVFDLGGPPQLVHAGWEGLPGGRVRLTYDFDDPAQLADFVRDDEYLQGRRGRLGELVGERTDVRVAGGALVGLGQAVLRHALGFAPPLTVRYQLAFRQTEELGSADRWFVLLGVCDDGREGYAGGLGRLDLEVAANHGVEAAIAEDRRPMYQNAAYAMELAHDGETVTLTMDGERMQALPAGELQGGGLFLLYHSDYHVEIRELVIEGRLHEGELERARAAWIEQRLDERGL